MSFIMFFISSGVPGKLDHASIVCYEVGCHDELENNFTNIRYSPKNEVSSIPPRLQHEGKFFLIFIPFSLMIPKKLATYFI